MNNFIGKDGFFWWVGVVENRHDPLNLSRCQIRIFGWHTENKQLLDTTDLPWALPVLPVNNSKTFTTPVEGDWVVGFFFDGASGQSPVYFGVLPGIAKSSAGSTQVGFTDPRTDGELAKSPAAPAQISSLADGSGTTLKNQPAQRNPTTSSVGYPSTNLLAQNDIKNPAPSIAQRYLNNTSGIPGPEAKSLNTAIAGAAQGAANAIQGTPQNFESIVPKPDGLSSAIKGSSGSVSNLMGPAFDFASSVLGNDPKTKKAIEDAKKKLANDNVDKQIADAEAAAAKQIEKSSTSMSLSLESLGQMSANLSNSMSAKLSGMSGDVKTQTPVIVDLGDISSLTETATAFETSLYKNTKDADLVYSGSDSIVWDRTNRERLRRKLPDLATAGYPRPAEKKGNISAAPKADIGAVAPAPLVNKVAPNPIPDQVPLNQTGSTQQKSLENSITLYENMVKQDTQDLIKKLDTCVTYEQFEAWVSEEQTIWKKCDTMSSDIEKSSGDSTVFTTLYVFTKKYKKQLSTVLDNRVATVKKG